MLGGPPICPFDGATVKSGGLGVACVLQYRTSRYINQLTSSTLPSCTSSQCQQSLVLNGGLCVEGEDVGR